MINWQGVRNRFEKAFSREIQWIIDHSFDTRPWGDVVFANLLLIPQDREYCYTRVENLRRVVVEGLDLLRKPFIVPPLDEDDVARPDEWPDSIDLFIGWFYPMRVAPPDPSDIARLINKDRAFDQKNRDFFRWLSPEQRTIVVDIFRAMEEHPAFEYEQEIIAAMITDWVRGIAFLEATDHWPND